MSEAADPLNSFATVFPRQLSYTGSKVMLLRKQLRGFERLPFDSQDAPLASQLKHLLGHARRHSPYWADRLPKLALAGKSCEEILQAVPVLSRKELQSEAKRLCYDFPNKKAMNPTWISTSGSTGTPVRYQQLRKIYGPLYLAATSLIVDWYGFDPNQRGGSLRAKHTDRDRVQIGRPFIWLGPTSTMFQMSTRTHQASELYEYSAQRNPSYLMCGPDCAFGLARYALKNGRNDLRPQFILTLGSVVTEEMREVVKQGLGAEILDRYICEESGYIAMQCPKHHHYHVTSPLNLVEIVDEQGGACPPGKIGRVLITSPQSYGMPLIRYEIGDMAEWGEPCDCGITLPVIKRIWGRVRHMIDHPDGSRTMVRIYARDFDAVPDLEEFRFVLHQNATVVAQLKGSERSLQTDALVRERVQRAIGYAYPVQIHYVERVDWGASGKQENFAVSDDPPPGVAPG